MRPAWEVSALKFNVFAHVKMAPKKVKGAQVGDEAIYKWRPSLAIQGAGTNIDLWI